MQETATRIIQSKNERRQTAVRVTQSKPHATDARVIQTKSELRMQQQWHRARKSNTLQQDLRLPHTDAILGSVRYGTISNSIYRTVDIVPSRTELSIESVCGSLYTDQMWRATATKATMSKLVFQCGNPFPAFLGNYVFPNPEKNQSGKQST
jgi:hypothetical protein